MRALRVWYAILNAAVVTSLTIDYGYRDIPTKTKIELSPVAVTCFRNDIVKLSAPIINERTLYYLHEPNGDVTELELPSPERNGTNREDGESVTDLCEKDIGSATHTDGRTKVYSLSKSKTLFEDIEAEMLPNEYLLGPVSDGDHGNWVLSLYTKDFNDEWVELFQVITIKIVEATAISPRHTTLKVGSTFNIQFVSPIPGLESCQLIAPPSTYDRFYARDVNVDSNRCGYVLPNITKEDEGIWTIEAVGNIVYKGSSTLYVREKNPRKRL